MSRYPGAIWKPIEPQYLSGLRMAAYNRVNLHVAVSEAVSLHGFFNAKGRASSHFYVRKDGTVEQYVDTDYRAEADLDGNDATISIETQGGLKNANGEPWTDAQLEALAKLYAWAVTAHDVPKRIAVDSRPGASSHGLSWHRLGVDGAFPALPSPLAGREQRGGGMRYSHARGKACPGDAKIRQVPTIYARALVLLGEIEEDDMATAQEIARAVWGFRNPDVSGGDIDAYAHLRRISGNTTATIVELAEQEGQIAGLLEAIKQITTGTTTVDVAAIKAAAKAGAAEGAAKLRVTIAAS